MAVRYYLFKYHNSRKEVIKMKFSEQVNSFGNWFSNLWGDITGTGESSARRQNEINRDFQQEMSNSAYQRSMADMKKAGINPALAFGQGGASTPSGASSAGGQASGIITSAMKMAKLKDKEQLQYQKLINQNLSLKNSALAHSLKK